MEDAFLRFTWKDNKTITRNTLLVIVFLTATFFIRDIIEVKNSETVHMLLFARMGVFCFILFSAIYIHRATSYFSRYHQLLLCNQIIISLGIFILTVVRKMPIANLGVNTILFTLIYFQFINNRFHYTVFSCVFFGFGAILTSFFFLDLSLSDFIASILFLVPVNFLGITILRSINQSRRFEYLALSNLKETNEEKEKVIQELRATLAEVKILRGFLPICASCKKIRDDKGYWNQIEAYIEKHSEAQFSHGICQDCAEKLYGNEEWFKRGKKEGTL